MCTQCIRCVGWTPRQGWRSGRQRTDGVVDPSIVKKTKTRIRVHDEGGGISHEEAEGQRTRNKDERIRGTMDAGEDGR